MSLYLISYDINEKDRDEYEGLWTELRNLKAQRILFSEWIVVGGPSQATPIYNQIAQHIRAEDRLLVQEVCGQASWDKLMMTASLEMRAGE